LDVSHAIVAHLLAAIKNKKFNGNINDDKNSRVKKIHA